MRSFGDIEALLESLKLGILEKAQMPLWRSQTLSPEISERQALLTWKLARSPRNTIILESPLTLEALEKLRSLKVQMHFWKILVVEPLKLEGLD